MFKTLLILLAIFTLLNISYGVKHYSSRLKNSTIKTNTTIPYDNYDDYYDYYLSDAYKHQINANLMFIFMIFFHIF